jgi:hypothetical protein
VIIAWVMKRRMSLGSMVKVHTHMAHIDRRRAYLCKVLHIEKNQGRDRINAHYKYMSYGRPRIANSGLRRAEIPAL